MTGVFIVLGLPVPLGVLAGLATGAVCGLINGMFIARMRIPPFIATLGMMYIAKGLSLVIAGQAPSTSTIRPLSTRSPWDHDPRAPGFPVPNAVLIMFGAAIVAA